MKKKFAYELGDEVELEKSEERGTVIGRAEYTERPPFYYVRYVAADGSQAEAWWSAEALVPAL